MDNLCHSLVGAALAQTGLRHKTRLATAALVLGANFPDIDIVAIWTDRGLGWRRGITHGLPAHVVLPFVLTGFLLLWARWRPARAGTPLDGRAVLALSALGIATHPVLDWLNVYGMRWLMPFDGTWFYGDALFIIDPWIWLALGVGVTWSARRWRSGHTRAGRPAASALAIVTAYIASMLLLTRVGRLTAADALGLDGPGPRQLMVAPRPIFPWHRSVVVDDGSTYRLGRIDWRPRPSLVLEGVVIDKGIDDPRRASIPETHAVRDLLDWARFPHFVWDDRSVRIEDARYSGGRRSFAGIDVPLR